MTHPTLEDAARAVSSIKLALRDSGGVRRGLTISPAGAEEVARAVLLSIRPPDREDLPLRQLEARDYIDGILNG